MKDSTRAAAGDQLITITRVLNAPPAVVFEAWTDPDQLAEWFGPAGMEVPRQDIVIEPHAGGRIRLRMVMPAGGMDYSLEYEIVEIAAPRLLVLRSGPNPQMGLLHAVETRIELTADGERTRLTLTDGPFPVEGGEGAARGWQGAFDKLEKLVSAV